MKFLIANIRVVFSYNEFPMLRFFFYQFLDVAMIPFAEQKKKKGKGRGINFIKRSRSSSRVEHRVETRQKSRINIGQYVLGINYH